MDRANPPLDAVRHSLAGRRVASEQEVFDALRALVDAGVDVLPHPGCGDTLGRWRVLASVAQVDLALGKVFESHADALSICAELRAPLPRSGDRWAVWAAESGRDRLRLAEDGGRAVRLDGHKHWCSGAEHLSHALVTAWAGAEGPYLVAVALDPQVVQITRGDWAAVGMADTATRTVEFHGAPGVLVGACGEYLSRAGFWHGAAGIAACWYGGAVALAHTLRDACRARDGDFRAAHLGEADAALAAARAALRDCAGCIDAAPATDARVAALRARAAVENAAERVLRSAGRALGAAPLCKDASFARHAADLPVFMRQGHAEHDLATLGRAATQSPETAWLL